MLFMGRGEAPEPEDLRCEYQATEVHVATLTSGVWQSAAIVVGGSIAAFAVLVDSTASIEVATAVTVLALGAVIVTAMWRYNWARHKASIDNCWVRMREIERVTGMCKNTALYALTQRGQESCKKFPEPPGRQALDLLRRRSIGEFISRLFPRRLFPSCGQDVLQGTAFLVQVGWFLTAVFKWVQAF